MTCGKFLHPNKCQFQYQSQYFNISQDASPCKCYIRWVLVTFLVFASIFLYLVILGNIAENGDHFVKCPCGDLHVDPAIEFAESELSKFDSTSGGNSWESLRKYHPNLPMLLINSSEPRCNLMPDIFRISWTGVHWQYSEGIGEESFLLYSAFYDNRTKTDPAGGVVRLVVLVSHTRRFYNPPLPWCHLWYRDVLEPVASRVVRADYIDWQWRSSDRLQSFILTCPTPDTTRGTFVPWAVSLVTTPCEPASNLLRVIGKPSNELPSHLLQPPNYNNVSDPLWRVGLCGPALFYYQDDFSVRLVEWLEVMKTLGVSKVFLYTTRAVHPNIDKVLRHYEKLQYVELVDFHYPPPYMDEPLLRRMWTLTERRRMFTLENIYFTDCLLRNKDDFRFLVHFDPDEVPVLLQHDSLPQLVAHLTNITADWPEPPPAYKLSWQYFPADVVTDFNLSSAPPHNTLGTTTLGLDAKVHKPSADSYHRLPTLPADAAAGALPSYLHVLRHTRRLVEDDIPEHLNYKSVYDTSDSTGAISHKVMVCAAGPCFASQELPLSVAYAGHFSSSGVCGPRCSRDPSATKDEPRLRRHLPQVVWAVQQVLSHLQLLPSLSEAASAEKYGEVV